MVAGAKPGLDPSLSDDQAEFAKLSTELFGDGKGTHKVGKGTVYAGQGLGDVLEAIHVIPDMDFTKPEADTRIEFVHRKLADGDAYFVANRRDRAEEVEVTFRVAGKVPEVWIPETGKTKKATYASIAGRTTVALNLDPWGTVFVVFRKADAVGGLTLPRPETDDLTTLNTDWKVEFQAGRGAPASIQLGKLADLSTNADAGVKYFSGVATYTKTVDAPAEWLKPGTKIRLDLGVVKNLAEVEVNGKSLGQVWHTPYAVDITSALKKGPNTIVVKVTNAWVNRLIGDAQPDVKEKITFTTVHPYKAKSKLQASGLIGPVSLVAETTSK